MLVTQELSDEFKQAKAIKKLHRFLITDGDSDPEGYRVFFGLQEPDDNINYFYCSEMVLRILKYEFSGFVEFIDQRVGIKLEHRLQGLFAGPKLKWLRAQTHMRELLQLLDVHGMSLDVRFEPVEGEDHTYRTVFSKPTPQWLPLVLGDVIHNLRSALDLLICDIARARNKSPSKLKFPFADNQRRYEDAIDTGEIRRLGSDVQKALKALKAFKDGNALLRGLHDLDIADKHDIIITVIEVAWGKYDIEKHIKAKVPGAPKIGFLGEDISTVMYQDG